MAHIVDITHLWKQAMQRAVAADFEAMHNMLLTVQGGIQHADPEKQLVFCKPIKSMIFEAAMDAVNPNDSFLYQ